MKELKKIKNVSEFSINNKNILLVEDAHRLLVCTDDNTKELLNGIGINGYGIKSIKLNQDNIFSAIYPFENSKSYFGSIFSNSITEKHNFIINKIEDSFLYCSEEDKGRKYDLNDNLLWECEDSFHYLYIYKNRLFHTKGNDSIYHYQLCALDDTTGAKLWHYTIPSEYNYKQRFDDKIYQDEISHIIGAHGDLLWIVLATGRLLGLSVEDGTLVHELTKPNNYVDEPYRRAYANNVFRAALHTQLDEAKGILFGLWKTFYWEIDLKNPTSSYLLYDITASFQHWNISAEMPNGYEWAWEKDEIFFSEIYDAERRDSTTNTVGIFDRSKKEVTWADRIGKKGEIKPIVQKIDYAAGRLYVLDGEGTLHIFER